MKKRSAQRDRAKAVRRMMTDALKDSGVTSGLGYAKVSNWTYCGVLGGTARQLKEERGLSMTASLRDHLESRELLQVMLTEGVICDACESGVTITSGFVREAASKVKAVFGISAE
jgi:hypothetical protein